MVEAVSGAGTPASEMGVFVGGEGLSVSSKDVSNMNNNEEVCPVIYDYLGSSLNLTQSAVIGIKFNNLNNDFQATRAHKRALTHLINDSFAPFLNESGGLLQSSDTIERQIRACDDGFKIVYFQNVCPNGCYLFPTDDKNVLSCPENTCGRSRYRRQEEAAEAIEGGADLNDDSEWFFAPVQKLAVVSVGAALAQLMINDDKISLFDYRKSLPPFDEAERVAVLQQRKRHWATSFCGWI
ncbi:hypothetical protein G6F56_012471 [Rhizopus delemar]|nr:hypothetical protein G6F56_012471 [Rhizopus delemar]